MSRKRWWTRSSSITSSAGLSLRCKNARSNLICDARSKKDRAKFRYASLARYWCRNTPARREEISANAWDGPAPLAQEQKITGELEERMKQQRMRFFLS